MEGAVNAHPDSDFKSTDPNDALKSAWKGRRSVSFINKFGSGGPTLCLLFQTFSDTELIHASSTTRFVVRYG